MLDIKGFVVGLKAIFLQYGLGRYARGIKEDGENCVFVTTWGVGVELLPDEVGATLYARDTPNASKRVIKTYSDMKEAVNMMVAGLMLAHNENVECPHCLDKRRALAGLPPISRVIGRSRCVCKKSRKKA
jgi:hypothetical protein